MSITLQEQSMNAFATPAFPKTLLAAPQLVGDAAVERSRNAARVAARALDGAKAPSHRLAEASLRANTVAHEAVARLVKNQLQVIDGLMDDGIRRLELVAEADSLRSLVAEQLELLADTRARLSSDARRTFAILADTRVQLAAALASPVSIAKAPATRRAAPAKTPRKKAVAATRKRPAKRATGTRRRAR
jgi:phasin family protein